MVRTARATLHPSGHTPSLGTGSRIQLAGGDRLSPLPDEPLCTYPVKRTAADSASTPVRARCLVMLVAAAVGLATRETFAGGAALAQRQPVPVPAPASSGKGREPLSRR